MVVVTTYNTSWYLWIYKVNIMAKQTEGTKKLKNKISRPGIHSKSKSSKLKSSKNYKKTYKSQGK